MSEKCSSLPVFIAALVVAAGFVLSAFLVQQGLVEFRSYDRYVTVKGLTTQEVEADLVIWPIKHAVTGGELPLVQQQVEANSQKIIAFLTAQGLSMDDIASRKLEVTDLLAQSYRQNGANDSNRYIVAETVIVRTNNVAGVEKAAQNVGDLIKQDVSLSRENNSGTPEYIFTKLNDIKPSMIAKATQNARESAEQFANDSGAEVGAIRDANQGVFEILPRDSDRGYEERQERYKTVRVVSTIKFYIE